MLQEYMDNTKSQKSIERLATAKYGIHINEEWANTENGMIISSTIFKLLVRMVKHIVVFANEEVHSNFKYNAIFTSWLEEAKNQDQDVSVSFAGTCDVLISLGCNSILTDIPIDIPTVYVYNNGWEASVGSSLPPFESNKSSTNPIGACLAASLGVAELFKYALKDILDAANVRYELHRNLTLSAFALQNEPGMDNPDLPDTPNVGIVHMVGAGAIGNAFVHTLASFNNIHGQLLVIDADIVDLSNLNRYILARKDDIGHCKVDLIKKSLNHTALNVVGFNETWIDFIQHYGRSLDTVVCTVDSAEARREIQSDLPRLLLDGATSGFTFSLSSHNFLEGACLGCIHLPNSNDYAVEEEMARILGWSVGEVFNALRTDHLLNLMEISQIEAYQQFPQGSLVSFVGKPLRTLWSKELCGRSSINKDQVEYVGTTGFVSIIPGILLAGELIKEVYFKDNVYKGRFIANVLTGPTKHSVQKPEKDSRCGSYCYDPAMIQAYNIKHTSAYREV
ncbi:ThiF family adenylyltransferase [Bacillus sp. V3-13]|uniref:ThiF family adenylyltransferase n=1 Tax=Bacillus sp. V3-13 TaxID=2053728 RepID=UPI0015E13F65|nr:ThiF family adenylyltransferase [Bacillus sp. V3-13]